MTNNVSNSAKKISTTQVIYLIIFLLLVGMVILYAGGTFDVPKITAVTNVGENPDHNHNNTDLTILNEIKSLEAKVENNPADTDALLNLAHLLNDSGFYNKAIVNYEKYLEKNPKNVDVIIDMGVCYFQLGKYDMAITTMEKGITINPKHQIAHFNLGIVNSTKGDHDKAIEYWKKTVKINPNSEIGIKAQNLLDNH